MTDARRPRESLRDTERLAKAERIFSVLLPHFSEERLLRILEVGTGVGAIASYFGRKLGEGAAEYAVDVRGQRLSRKGFEFKLVDGIAIPFEAGHFDLVVSNHVIEHVGDRLNQMEHVREILRVLKPSGIGYLAVPSRWQIIGPHYGIGFLSWLPRRRRSAYLKRRGRGNYSDCKPVSLSELESIFTKVGAFAENVLTKVVQGFNNAQAKGNFLLRILRYAHSAWLTPLRALSPTHVYLFGRARRG